MASVTMAASCILATRPYGGEFFIEALHFGLSIPLTLSLPREGGGDAAAGVEGPVLIVGLQ